MEIAKFQLESIEGLWRTVSPNCKAMSWILVTLVNRMSKIFLVNIIWYVQCLLCTSVFSVWPAKLTRILLRLVCFTTAKSKLWLIGQHFSQLKVNSKIFCRNELEDMIFWHFSVYNVTVKESIITFKRNLLTFLILVDQRKQLKTFQTDSTSHYEVDFRLTLVKWICTCFVIFPRFEPEKE